MHETWQETHTQKQPNLHCMALSLSLTLYLEKLTRGVNNLAFYAQSTRMLTNVRVTDKGKMVETQTTRSMALSTITQPSKKQASELPVPPWPQYLIKLTREEDGDPDYVTDGVQPNPAHPGWGLEDLVEDARDAILVEVQRAVALPDWRHTEAKRASHTVLLSFKCKKLGFGCVATHVMMMMMMMMKMICPFL